MTPIMLKTLLATLTVGIAHAFPTPFGNSPNDNTELIGKLITAPNQAQRYRKLLTDASGSKLLAPDELAKATIWDFNQNYFNVTGSQGGINSGANIETFPLLIGAGLTVNSGTVGPCGILLPHVHPRANEFFIVTDNELIFGAAYELGLFADLTLSPEITGTLKKNSGTVFPQGSVHWQVNDSENCKEATFVAVLSNEDPGTTTILQEPAGNRTMGKRMVGKEGFETVRAVTPPHITAIIDKCFARCNIA